MINFNAPINRTTGYGITSTNIWQLLRDRTEIALYPIGQGIDCDPELQDLVKKDFENTMGTDLKKNDCFKIWHQHDLAPRFGNGKYSALTFFELDTFQKNEVASLHHPDQVFVASEWGKEVVANHGISKDNIHVTPLGVNLNIFNPDLFKEQEKEESKYVFINIGKWEIRKGHDLLVNIFNEAFSEKDNVELWMINHNPFLNQDQTLQWHKLYKESKLGDKIKIFPRIEKHVDLASVIDQADCGIYLSRGEGWNNEVMETMAMNKPVILTNYSAHTEYANSENSYLVQTSETEKAQDGIWFHGQGNWATLGVDQIEQSINHMRNVYKNNIRTNANGLKTAEKYTWQNTVDQISKYVL